MKDLVRVFNALSDPVRIRIIKLLLHKKKMCVCELTAILKIGQPTVSHHLRILKDAGLVFDVRNKLWIDYEISKEKGNKYVSRLNGLLSGLLESDQKILEDRKLAAKVSREELCRK
jgi:ArsR family transcriptional regulator